MALNSLFLWTVLLSSVIGTNAEGQFVVLHQPSSLNFFGFSSVKENLLKDIYCVALGLSTDRTTDWEEMNLLNPFETPEAVVEVYVDGLSDIGLSDSETKVYRMSANRYQAEETADYVAKRVIPLKDVKNKLVDINLSDDVRMYDSLFGEYTSQKFPKLSLKHLKYSVEEDYHFIYELQVLKAITAAVKGDSMKPDYKVDFFQFKFTSLRMLVSLHGPRSEQIREAKELLNKYIRELNTEFVKAYNGNVLITAVITGGDITHKRQALDVTDIPNMPFSLEYETAVFRQKRDDNDNTTSTTTTTTTTEAPEVVKSIITGAANGTTTDVAFVHIIFWTSFVLMCTMIAIIYVFMSMDPGRDSVVYRMTTTKL